MLKLSPAYLPTGDRLIKGSRSRVVGQGNDNSLLFLVNTTTRTSINLVQPNGKTIIASSFLKYMDIVSADISIDNSILHITERIVRDSRFVFHSYFLQISTGEIHKEIESIHPMTAKFFNFKNKNEYQAIHVVGNGLSHLRILLIDNKMQIERVRGGCNFHSVVTWQFDKLNNSLNVIYEVSGKTAFSKFTFYPNKIVSSDPIYFDFEKSYLTPELALNPISLRHLPIFKFKFNRVFTTIVNDRLVVIQQILPEDRSCSKFSVYIPSLKFKRTYSIDNVDPSLPLCILNFDQIIAIACVPQYICLIDVISQNPEVYIYQGKLAYISNCEAATQCFLPNLICDLANGSVFEVSFDLNCIIENQMDVPQSLARILAVIANAKLISQALKATFKLNAQSLALFLFNFLDRVRMPETDRIEDAEKETGSIPEHVKSQLEFIEREFPSAGVVTRKASFWAALKEQKKMSRSSSNSSVAETTIERLVLQNAAVTALGEGIRAASVEGGDRAFEAAFFARFFAERMELPAGSLPPTDALDERVGNAELVAIGICELRGLWTTTDEHDDGDHTEAAAFELEAL